MKRGISRVVEKVKEHIEKWKTPGRKKMIYLFLVEGI
jgi:hypothetical protein